ncbi:hypothetical protein Ciccas_008759, partial [Cichlidogyrus casuarinus]
EGSGEALSSVETTDSQDKPMALKWGIQVPLKDVSELSTYRCVAKPSLSAQQVDSLGRFLGEQYVANLKSQLDELQAERVVQLVQDSKPGITVSTKTIHTGYDQDEAVY